MDQTDASCLSFTPSPVIVAGEKREEIMDAIKESPLETIIDRVDVSRDGARVFRSGKIDLMKGPQKLRISGLTKMLMKDSVRLSGRGKGTLGAIDVESRYQEEVSHDVLKDLRGQETRLQKEQGLLQERLSFATHQKEVLDSLGSRFASEFPTWFASGDTSLSALTEFLEFEKKRSADNLTERSQLNDEIEELSRKLETLQAQINDYQNQGRVEQTTEVVVSVEAEAAGPFLVELSYQTQGVNWKPSYDADLGPDKASLKGFAEVYNGTLENWEDVELTISTAVFRPVRIAEPEPYYVDVYQPGVPGASGPARSLSKKMKSADLEAAAPEEAMGEEEVDEMYDKELRAELVVPEATLQESPSGVQSFEIPGRWTIPADGNTHPVTLVTFDLPTEKQFYWLASDSPAVIAVDRLTNGEGVILAGKVKVYSEGEFIGETSVGQIAPGEEFELGAREELKMKAEKKLMGMLKERTGLIKGKRSAGYEYRLTVKNFRNETSAITIKDVIPYSQSERIKVKWLDCTVKTEEDNLGIYTWKTDVKADDECVITYRYEVEWEKDYTISPPLP